MVRLLKESSTRDCRRGGAIWHYSRYTPYFGAAATHMIFRDATTQSPYLAMLSTQFGRCLLHFPAREDDS